MSNDSSSTEYEETVNFDQDGNVTVNKDTHASKKLVARRAIEAMRERRQIEKEMDAYYPD